MTIYEVKGIEFSITISRTGMMLGWCMDKRTSRWRKERVCTVDFSKCRHRKTSHVTFIRCKFDLKNRRERTNNYFFQCYHFICDHIDSFVDHSIRAFAQCFDLAEDIHITATLQMLPLDSQYTSEFVGSEMSSREWFEWIKAYVSLRCLLKDPVLDPLQWVEKWKWVFW